jgi:lipoprotein signal peptidase
VSDSFEASPGVPSQAIRLAVALVLLEAVALVALAAVEVVSLNSNRVSVGVTSAVFFGLYAAGLALAARGLYRLRAWSRGPVVLAQLIELGVAWSFAGNNTTWVSVLVAIPAIVVLIIIFRPTTTDALYGHRVGEE